MEKWKIGLIGSMYYFGIITTVILVPYWSDRVGRRWISLASFYVFMIAMFGIFMARDSIWLYVFVFITGTTFPGRANVAINWLLEF